MDSFDNFHYNKSFLTYGGGVSIIKLKLKYILPNK